MAVPNEVKFKVRHHALLLEEFTVAQIVQLTGLKSTSVRTEVQRMKREGLLSSHREKGKGRGAPPCVYKLTDDPEARLELSRSVEAFYTEIAPKPVEPRRPVSRHFFQAVKLIRDLTCQRVEEDDQEAVIDEALYHLEFARREEGVGREGTEVVGACLDREQARLESVRGNISEAERLFRQAGAAFEAAGLHREVEQTRGDWLWAQLCQQLQAAKISGETDIWTIIRSFSQTVSHACETKLTDSPLAIALREVFEWLVERQPRGRVLENANEQIRRAAYEGTLQAFEEKAPLISQALAMMKMAEQRLPEQRPPKPRGISPGAWDLEEVFSYAQAWLLLGPQKQRD
jgi:DNA-binding PadR family transcriptional regulator